MELIQTIEQWAWIGWVVLILVFLVIEMLTLDFTFLMLSIGGLAGLGADLLGAPLWLQVIIAAVIAALLVMFLRPPLLRRLRRLQARLLLAAREHLVERRPEVERERLAVYPEYTRRPEFIDERLRLHVARLVDGDGLVRPDLEVWRSW